jgi:hypothetical protein
MTVKMDFTRKDERTAMIPVPAAADTMHKLADWIEEAANDGYKLTDVSDIQGGHQSDPYTVGLKLWATRT